MDKTEAKRTTESWGSKVGLVMAVAGSAVGLGNFLRFPVQALQNGGGAFLLPYLLSFLFLGIPLLWVEWAMGRYGGQQGKHSPAFIFQALDPKRKAWAYGGALGIFINLVVAAYYCYIESWTLTYAIISLKGHFAGMSMEQVSAWFSAYTTGQAGTPWVAILMFFLTVVLNCLILGQGLSKGIERISLIGMPLLILLAMFLAYKGITLSAGEDGAVYDGAIGLNYLWSPRPAALLDPNVWLAAAGQIFFTTAVGMGIIHCYASYMKKGQDISLSAMTAGWMNEFVEVVLGSSILIPIAIGYLGIEAVQELTKSGGLGLAFRTMPYLFAQWGPVLGAVAGFSFFILLFFAGITSSLAMGTPWMSFMTDEFDWSRLKGTISFGVISIILGLPCILFMNEGWLDEFDYWGGTISLVVFALIEVILFGWVFGIDKGWAEINDGAELRPWRLFKPVIKYVMPVLLILFLSASLISPQAGDWGSAFSQLFAGQGWPFADASLWGKLGNQGLKAKLLGASEADQASIMYQIWIANAARLTLLGLLLGLFALIWMAHRRSQKQLMADLLNR